MRVYVLDTEEQSFNVVETEGGLSEWYRLLHCDMIDIVSREIGGKYFDIICDDEGLFKEEKIVSVFNQAGEPQIVGSVAICNYDSEGNETTLTPDDEKLIAEREAIATRADGEQFRVVVID